MNIKKIKFKIIKQKMSEVTAKGIKDSIEKKIYNNIKVIKSLNFTLLKKKFIKFISIGLVFVSIFLCTPIKSVRACELSPITYEQVQEVSICAGPFGFYVFVGGVTILVCVEGYQYFSEYEKRKVEQEYLKSKELQETLKAAKQKHESKKLPQQGEPNGFEVDAPNGIIYQRRFYDEKGRVKVDIDYHQDKLIHPWSFHIHEWKNNKRGEGRKLTHEEYEKYVKPYRETDVKIKK